MLTSPHFIAKNQLINSQSQFFLSAKVTNLVTALFLLNMLASQLILISAFFVFKKPNISK